MSLGSPSCASFLPVASSIVHGGVVKIVISPSLQLEVVQSMLAPHSASGVPLGQAFFLMEPPEDEPTTAGAEGNLARQAWLAVF